MKPIIYTLSFLFFTLCLVVSPAQQAAAQPDTEQPTPTLETKSKTTFTNAAQRLDWQKDNSQSCGGFYKEPKVITQYPHPTPLRQNQTIITAEGPTILVKSGRSLLKKNVIVTQPGRQIRSDSAYLYRDKKTGKLTKITLMGHVRMREANKLLVSDQATLNLKKQKTWLFFNSAYHLHGKTAAQQYVFDAWGVSSYAQKTNEKMILHNATYTTCRPDAPSWWVKAKRIILDKTKQIGTAYHATLRFKGVPIFYAPYYSFPLKHQRKTGLLTPRYAYTERLGSIFSFPFYWNLAPNYDATLTTQYITKRNMRLISSFRFLNASQYGDLYLSYLFNDIAFGHERVDYINTFSNIPSLAPYIQQLKKMHNQRAFFSFNDRWAINSEWQAYIDLKLVSDPYYFQDMGGAMGTNTLINQLRNTLGLNYQGQHWHWQFITQAYQTLNMVTQSALPSLDQYKRLPEIQGNAFYPSDFLDLTLETDFNNFTYKSSFTPDKPIGQRLHIKSGITHPFYFPSGYIKPELWLDGIAYQVAHTQSNQSINPTRLLPIADLDAGLYLYRNVQLGAHDLIQTLEPRIFYLWIPYQNQERLPNFDTVLTPFSFEQFFLLNQFIGNDRIQNANRVSFSVTSQVLSADTGASLLSISLGFLHYFERQRVCLFNECTPNNIPQHVSPIIAKLTFHPSDAWSVASNLTWNAHTKTVDNGSVIFKYERNAHHIASISYLFVHGNQNGLVGQSATTAVNNNFSQNTSLLDMQLIWPIHKKWNTLGYWLYDISQHRTYTYALGFQYDSHCWDFQAVVRHTYAGSNAHNQFDTGYFLQLEFKGLGSIDSGNSAQFISNTNVRFTDILRGV